MERETESVNHILFTDPHFTDSPLDEYRWDIFKNLEENAKKYDVGHIVCLGDCTDRKDRHSAVLVNKLIEYFSDLKFETKSEIVILPGNHDKPLTGPYYWDFLNELGISYRQQNLMDMYGIILFPFSPDPVKEWKDWLPVFNKAKAVMMHQTVEGVVIEGDYKLDGTKGLLGFLPSDIPIFSGDAHRPQRIRNITYVGTPHPIKFSETWANRIILIKNDDFKNPIDIWLPSIKRAILDIESVDQLKDLDYKEKDQLKIRYKLSADKLTDWPVDEERIRKWASNTGIHLQSVEAVLTGDTLKKEQTDGKVVELLPPIEIIKLFSEKEKLSKELVEMAMDCLKESQ